MAKFITRNNILPIFAQEEQKGFTIISDSVKPVLSKEDLQMCLDIRRRVFIVEQNFPSSLEDNDKPSKLQKCYIAKCEIVTDAGVRQWIPVGTARLIPLSDKVCKMSRVAVLSDVRGRSIGRKLMLAIMQDAREQGIKEIVLDAQTHARRFYEKLGFSVNPEDEGGIMFHGVPHIVMWNRTISEQTQ